MGRVRTMTSTRLISVPAGGSSSPLNHSEDSNRACREAVAGHRTCVTSVKLVEIRDLSRGAAGAAASVKSDRRSVRWQGAAIDSMADCAAAGAPLSVAVPFTAGLRVRIRFPPAASLSHLYIVGLSAKS